MKGKVQAMHRWKRVIPVLMLGILLAAVSAGCGKKTEKTQEAMALIEELDYEGALAVFTEASENKENKGLIYRGMGIAYLGLTRYEEAVGCFLNALACSDGLVQDVDFDLNYYLATAYSQNGQFEEAKEVYNSILTLRPQEKNALFLRANVELELDQFTEAKEDFDAVVEMEPENYERLFSIYEVFSHFGYREAGKEYLQTALDNGEKKLSSFDKGRIYYYMEEYQKAYVELEDARGDGTAQSSLYLGKAYEATGEYNYACNVYRSYVEKQGDSAEMFNQLGVCELKRKNYKEALEAFQAGLALQDREMQQILSYNEIVACEYLGDFEKAASLIEIYVRNYPGDEQARREMEFLSTRQKSPEE